MPVCSLREPTEPRMSMGPRCSSTGPVSQLIERDPGLLTARFDTREIYALDGLHNCAPQPAAATADESFSGGRSCVATRVNAIEIPTMNAVHFVRLRYFGRSLDVPQFLLMHQLSQFVADLLKLTFQRRVRVTDARLSGCTIQCERTSHPVRVLPMPRSISDPQRYCAWEIQRPLSSRISQRSRQSCPRLGRSMPQAWRRSSQVLSFQSTSSLARWCT